MLDIGCQKSLTLNRLGNPDATFVYGMLWALSKLVNSNLEKTLGLDVMHILVKMIFQASHPSNEPQNMVRSIHPFPSLIYPIFRQPISNECRYSISLHSIIKSCIISIGVRFNISLPYSTFSSPPLSSLSVCFAKSWSSATSLDEILY